MAEPTRGEKKTQEVLMRVSRIPADNCKSIRAFSFTLLVLCACGVWPVAAVAQDNWLGGADLWSNGAKWSAGVPGPSSNVFIDHGLAGASSVTINFNGAQCANLTIDGDDALIMVDGTIFTLNGPTISNAGSISLNSAGFGTYFNFGGAVTLSGAGALTMSNSSGNYLMGYAQPSPGASLTNKSTIQGAGNIGFNGIGNGNSFTNQGTVNANQTTPLNINIGGGATVTNTGTLEATNGATLTLNNGTVTNTGGTIHADPASVVTLSSATISGGMLTTSGTGTIQANCCLSYSTLNGVTLNGTFQLNSNNIGYLQGTITDNGSMQLNAPSGTNVVLDMVGGVTLKGTGTLTSNNSNNAIMGYGQTSPASLTNQITIQGAGAIGGAGGIGNGNTFTNQATVNANQSNPFTITIGNSTVANTGTLEATNGATLVVQNGTLTNTGGILHADPASTVQLYNITVSGGTLTTSGTGKFQAICCLGYSTLDGVTINGAFQWVSNNIGYLQGTITNNGPMSFNSPPGTNVVLDVNGAVTLKGSGTLTSTNANNSIMGYAQAGPGASLTNQSTIQGTGTFGGAGGIGTGNSITNQGTIFANQKTSLFINVNSGTLTNTGTLKVKAGSVMYIGGPGFTNFSGTTLTGGKYMVSGTLQFDNANIVTNAASITLTGAASRIINQSAVNGLANLAANAKASSLSLLSGKMLATAGSFSNAGKVTVGVNSTLQIGTLPNGTYTQMVGGMTTVDGTLTAPTGVNIQAGSLLGKGTINATVVSSGSVTAGDSATKPGKLSLSTYTQTASGSLTGSLNIPITSDTTFGQLAVANGVSLNNGPLNVKRLATYIPAIGKSFTVLTGGIITGSFSNSTVAINSGEHFAISYNRTGTPQTVTLTVVSGP
jgi:hypothetical protein